LIRSLRRLLRGLGWLTEQRTPSADADLLELYDLSWLATEREHFSTERDWMPGLVLVAKSTYVWLDQLAKRYRRPITRLDQVPDEELDRLPEMGLSGLWLVGLWERSPASRKIKRLLGDPEALASAYSLYDYRVAQDLGGETALENLRQRAAQRGLRLASDMVPNHMGVDSRWVIEHPEWFLALDESPFPSYSFTGVDLCDDPRVGVYIEDHYLDHSDAAVVFKHVDQKSGRQRFIYHGNDGTGMPWNDTAQLNYLVPELREAVIATILRVARQFPIIRFDAAMALAKRHIQRLWFPRPGDEGAIPSRSEHGMSQAEFDASMPVEFWREVVERVGKEAPDTLLLAEAFWTMEGYFARNLGLHRVYNSAFMHLLRDEDNAEYRRMMKSILAFDPRILERFVNFMTSPDEEPAAVQFGRGEKYFGVCTLLVTLPGTPMFGHGQIEGFIEKYGMEYQRARLDEGPDAQLVERHQRQIVPLLRRRRLFATVDRFLLYDFHTPDGEINQDVFAYSNCLDDQSALVVYHNCFADTRGRIKTSVDYAPEPAEGGQLVRKTLGEALDFGDEENGYCIYRDLVSGLEHLCSSRELHEKGLFLELGAYQAYVFLDFRQVTDNESGDYAALAQFLDGRGLPSVERAVQTKLLESLIQPFARLVNPKTYRTLIEAGTSHRSKKASEQALEIVVPLADEFLAAANEYAGGSGDRAAATELIRRYLRAALQLPASRPRLPLSLWLKYRAARKLIRTSLGRRDTVARGTLAFWVFTQALACMLSEAVPDNLDRHWIDEWMLGEVHLRALEQLGADRAAARRNVDLVKLLLAHHGWASTQASEQGKAYTALQSWLEDPQLRDFLGVNRHRGVLWFDKEAMDEWLRWMLVVAAVGASADESLSVPELSERVAACYEIIKQLRAAATASGYKLEQLLEIVRA